MSTSIDINQQVHILAEDSLTKLAAKDVRRVIHGTQWSISTLLRFCRDAKFEHCYFVKNIGDGYPVMEIVDYTNLAVVKATGYVLYERNDGRLFLFTERKYKARRGKSKEGAVSATRD